MSIETGGRLALIDASGSPYDVGVMLGRFGRAAAHRHLITTHGWASVMAHRDDPFVVHMREMTEALLPGCWQELRGLAFGLELPFDDVFLWNCRGEVRALVPDGCTTVQVPGRAPVIAHNEDGDPGLRGFCAIAQVRPAQGKAFNTFVYPASMPGHTFAVTETGLVQAVNNIRPRHVGPGLPRMLLGRAVLDCATLDDALRLIGTARRAGAFHFTLAQRGDGRLVGVEFTHKSCSVTTVAAMACHANHLVHESMAGEPQSITGSSAARQRRGDEIIGAGKSDPLAILWDTGNKVLPVYRTQSDDPDDENTLATALFEIGAEAVGWRVFDRAGTAPRFGFEDLAALPLVTG